MANGPLKQVLLSNRTVLEVVKRVKGCNDTTQRGSNS